ncbi:MAG: T9SS type A sorting domain-containing protein [Bacteroidales bacterium]|nr:T9SS type A sorting domain-containing protein [Bacteroidales bacterium]
MTVIEIEVIDLQGQTVLRRSEGVIPGINRISVDGAGLSRGIYTLRISDEGKTVTRKVVKG